MATTPVFLQGKFHGQRSLAGYHPWGCQKSATTEHTSMWSIQQCHHHEVAQSCLTLRDPMDCNPSGSFIHGIFQTKVLEWVAISFLQGKKKKKVKLLVAQSCLILCGPVDCKQPGSSVHGILEARILEWEAILFSKESSLPRDQTQPPALQADFLPSEPPVKSIIHAFLQIK